jgi:hypothetical protein
MLDSLLPTLSMYLPSLLAEGGIVVVESPAGEHPELRFRERTSRTYGSVRLTVFEQA